MRVKQHVGAVEGVEVDQVEVDLPPELEVDVPADVPPAEERVEDVELVLTAARGCSFGPVGAPSM